MGSEFDSRSKGSGFESHLILDGNGVKAMPGSIIVPNPGSFKWKEKNTGSQMRHTKKKLKKPRS